MLILIAVKGPDKGTVFELTQDQSHLIGRQSETVRMRDRKLSRRHAELSFEQGAWVIRDVGSTNGTRVNAERIDGPTQLKDGDRIQLGRTVFVVGRLHAEAQPMHATRAPELDAAMQLHDSEHDYRYEEPDAAEELDELIAAEQSGAPASHRSTAASAASSDSARSHAAARTPRRSQRPRTQRSQDERPRRLTNGPIHPKFAAVPESSSRGFWVLAAGVLIAIGLLTTLHLRLSQHQRSLESMTPEASLAQQRQSHQEVLAKTQEMQERINQIAGLIKTQGQQQHESIGALQQAMASLTADQTLVDKVLEEIRTLPHSTGEQLARDVLAAIEVHAEQQKAMLEEVRIALESQSRPVDDKVMNEVLAELRRRPVEASNNMAVQVIEAMRASAREQTDALLAAIEERPEPASADMVKQVLAELRAKPDADNAVLAKELADAVEAQTSRQTAALLEQMRRSLDESRPASDRTMRELIAALRDQPRPDVKAFAREVAAAVQHENQRHSATMIEAMRTAVANQQKPGNDPADAVLAELRGKPLIDVDALTESISTAIAARMEQSNEALVEKLMASAPQVDMNALGDNVLAAVTAEPAVTLDPAVLTESLVAAVKAQSQAHNEALLAEVRQALQEQSPSVDRALVEQVLAQVKEIAAATPDADTLAEALAVAVNTQTQRQNEALLEAMRTALETQPRPASEELVKQIMVRVQAQAAEHNQAVLAELRAQLQLENQALLEELLASLQQGEGRLADASGSRLLSHMRQLAPGPVTLERQRAQQHETFASRQLGPVASDAPRSPALLAASAELFTPALPDQQPLPPNAVGDEPPAVGQEVRTATGLRYVIEKAGQGDAAQKGDAVLVHYTGYLANGTMFDSSRARNKPFGFQLGSGSVIKGWEEGVLGMKKGEKRTLHIPADLAYGSRGAGRNIPPNADLTFEMELITIVKAPGSE